MDKLEATTWARQRFFGSELGDARRSARLRAMATRARQRPAGRVAQVFTTPHEQQAAYDFLESRHLSPDAIVQTVAASTARAAASEPFVFVAVDGTSLTLVDRRASKDFGAIGRHALPTRGLKVITALAVSPGAAPIGLATTTYWARPRRPKCAARTRKRTRVKTGTTEMQHWRASVEAVEIAFTKHAPGTARWYVMDREADSADMLTAMLTHNARFTIRSRHNRHMTNALGQGTRLEPFASGATLFGTRVLDVLAGPKRAARRTRVELRSSEVVLHLPDYAHGRRPKAYRLTVVVVREQTPPPGEKPISWRLLTSHKVLTLDDLELVVRSYAARWRIEDFHRAWKTGGCHVEDTQLRSKAAVIAWATLLAAVAIDVERLKHLARSSPDEPASLALTPLEIEVLRLAKRREKKRTESVPDSMPSLAQATRWIADLGGYTGKSSGGPPGSITLGRGLERLRALAEGYALARRDLE